MPRTHVSTRRRATLAVTTGVGITLAGVLVGGPASASVIDRGTYVDPYTDTFDACGTTVDVNGASTGHFVEILRGAQPLSYVAEHFVDRTTFTNTATGRSWSTVTSFTHLDLSI